MVTHPISDAVCGDGELHLLVQTQGKRGRIKIVSKWCQNDVRMMLDDREKDKEREKEI
jgi:hypothetical protein